jgi:hypothetical protein
MVNVIQQHSQALLFQKISALALTACLLLTSLALASCSSDDPYKGMSKFKKEPILKAMQKRDNGMPAILDLSLSYGDKPGSGLKSCLEALDNAGIISFSTEEKPFAGETRVFFTITVKDAYRDFIIDQSDSSLRLRAGTIKVVDIKDWDREFHNSHQKSLMNLYAVNALDTRKPWYTAEVERGCPGFGAANSFLYSDNINRFLRVERGHDELWRVDINY